MTRKEQIMDAAMFFAKKNKNNPSPYLDFVEAAEWADRTMIEKACEWIESYLFDIGFPDDWCRDSENLKSGKQRFIEAMEE